MKRVRIENNDDQLEVESFVEISQEEDDVLIELGDCQGGVVVYSIDEFYKLVELVEKAKKLHYEISK